MLDKIVIDVSQYNGVINWNKVDADEVYIRIGYRGYTAGTIKQDIKFLANVQAAIKVGIAVGFYFMSQAINESEAIEEANYVVDCIKDFPVELPIMYDSELSGAKNNTGRADHLSKTQRTAIVIAFCDRIKELNYESGVYASTSWFKSNLDVSQLLNYHIWVAQYASNCTATHRKDMWQYTSKGSIAGISGNVDISHSYTDFTNSTVTATNNLYTEPTYCLYKGRLTQSKEYVKWLQYHLIRLGHMDKFNTNGKSNIDGFFGKITDTAFRDFQSANPCTYTTNEPDGKCGTLSRNCLKNIIES
ncbi:MAG: GH25 family lysozyme [Lachnotalea sp.]